jgi:hypothetical protein
MPENKKGGKEEAVRDGMIKLVKGSEFVAMQAVDSAASVLKFGLEKMEDLNAKASDVMLNKARRTINAGVIVGSDVCEATEKIAKETIRTASKIGSDLKEAAVCARKKSVAAEKKEEESR